MACTNLEPLPEPSPSAERQVKAAPRRRDRIGGNLQQAFGSHVGTVRVLSIQLSVCQWVCSLGENLQGELVCEFSRRSDETVDCPELRICEGLANLHWTRLLHHSSPLYLFPHLFRPGWSEASPDVIPILKKEMNCTLTRGA